MKSGKKKKQRLGKIVFFAPVIIIIGLVVYGYFQVTAPGTLIVQAQLQDKYLPAPNEPTMLNAPVEIGQTIETTPATVSESPGVYQVIFGPLAWYITPYSRNVTVTNHGTVYAVGGYEAMPRVIEVTAAGGFNNTSFTAEHQVTPVIWLNPSSTFVQFEIVGIGSETVQAGSNLTMIFQNSGDFAYNLEGGSGTPNSGSVSVS